MAVFPLFAGVGERTREGNDLWIEMQEAGIVDRMTGASQKVALVYGQMTEPPGCAFARWPNGPDGLRSIFETKRGRTCCSSSTIFSGLRRRVSEVSALLGRMPSAVGYQPNLATENG